MGQYTYDTTGQSYFFLLTALLFFLLPFTYFTFASTPEKRSNQVPKPCKPWNVKSEEVKRVTKSLWPFTKRQVIVAVGWIALAAVVHQARNITGEAAQYDPFAILGIRSGASETDIKRHYRKLSVKFHPDKLTLAENQTKEEADSHFVELTKAYKALTDEEVRKNFEMYGHPDGKQEYTQGIALPSWVVESKNVGWVMGAYALGLGVLLPLLVARWWYGSRKRTKDGVLNSTAALYFRTLKEHTPFPSLVTLLAASDEFTTDPELLKLRKTLKKAGVDEYARLVANVREKEEKAGKEGWEGYSSWSAGKKRARTLLVAHMLRFPISDLTLLKEKHRTVKVSLGLSKGLANIALAHNWLSTYISILHLQQFLLQAVHWTSSPLLQLPYVGPEVAKQLQEKGIESVEDFGKKEWQAAKALAQDIVPEELKQAHEVARVWPVIEVVEANFKVVGESNVTPQCFVNLTLKLRLAPPGVAKVEDATTKEKENQVALRTATLSGPDKSKGEIEADDEEEERNKSAKQKKAEAGEEPTPLAHTPMFPGNHKPSWFVFIGDHKLNRIFVPPQRFTDVGPNKTRKVQISFQAPPGPGLYTFQTYVMCDSFVGTDTQRDMRMKVDPPKEEEDIEDDISEPDEDSLAGQMALMKGQPVKRIYDDESSGSETEESEDESSSDSDSD